MYANMENYEVLTVVIKSTSIIQDHSIDNG